MDMMDSLLNRNEIRRLEKAAREKDKKHLLEWAMRFEDSIRRIFEKEYQAEIQTSVDNFMIAVAYTLYFSEETVIRNKKDVGEFMSDLFSTLDLYRTGEYNPQEYKEILNKAGVFFDEYDYSKLYKNKLDKLDKLIKKYEDLIQQNTNDNQK